MKLNLLLILIITITSTGYADTTLVFNVPGKSGAKQQLTYYIKDGRLRFKESGINKINTFDQNKQEFISFNPDTGNISRINRDLVNQHVEKLNQQRLQQLNAVERDLHKKLETMKAEKKEIAEVLMNKLKYPEFYGDHTYLKSSKTNTTRKVNDVECLIHNVHRNEILVRQICMASMHILKMTADDLTTLRSFYKFNYDTQSQLAIASGKTSFTYIDYEEHNFQGIPIEVTVFTNQGSHTEQSLQTISHETLENSLFEIKMP